jgi:two-component system, OmpR family, phosphate regulon sensor histidine kinase PhoR
MQRKFLEIMRDQSERIESLVTDLLTLSNIQAGAGKSKFLKFTLIEALDKSLQGLGKIINDRKIKITRDIKTQISNITGNFDEIARVCENLISNAIKYSPADKPETEIIITIENTDNFELDDEKYQLEQKFIKFSVQDFGEGIAEESIPRLTERFFRVDKARSSKISGSGLGLAIVKHILDNHGAVLRVKSSLGKGSIFSVYFPV